MLNWWLLLLLPAIATAYQCNFLPEEYRQPNHTTFSNLTNKFISAECPARKNDTLYACFTSVAKGIIFMGCYAPTFPSELRQLCEESIRDAEEKCDYALTTPYGAFHPTPGRGMCCCGGIRCNRPPPYWLVSEHLLNPRWYLDFQHGCFFLVFSTILVWIFSVLGGIHYLLEMAFWAIVGRPEATEVKKKPTEITLANFEEVSAIAELFKETENRADEGDFQLITEVLVAKPAKPSAEKVHPESSEKSESSNGPLINFNPNEDSRRVDLPEMENTQPLTPQESENQEEMDEADGEIPAPGEEMKF